MSIMRGKLGDADSMGKRKRRFQPKVLLEDKEEEGIEGS